MCSCYLQAKITTTHKNALYASGASTVSNQGSYFLNADIYSTRSASQIGLSISKSHALFVTIPSLCQRQGACQLKITQIMAQSQPLLKPVPIRKTMIKKPPSLRGHSEHRHRVLNHFSCSGLHVICHMKDLHCNYSLSIHILLLTNPSCPQCRWRVDPMNAFSIQAMVMMSRRPNLRLNCMPYLVSSLIPIYRETTIQSSYMSRAGLRYTLCNLSILYSVLCVR